MLYFLGILNSRLMENKTSSGSLHIFTGQSTKLLHRSIAGGKFIQSQGQFCNLERANYFDIVGKLIAIKLLDVGQKLKIWVDRNGEKDISEDLA